MTNSVVVVKTVEIARVSLQAAMLEVIIQKKMPQSLIGLSQQQAIAFLNFMEDSFMKKRTILGTMVMMVVLVQMAFAGGKEDLQKYFNDTASKVKATEAPAQKREILSNSLQTMSKALDKVQNMPMVSAEDRSEIARFKAALQEKQDELAGSNGFERVPDAQLNAFSDYVVQDMEQASRTITLSLVSVLLIVIIIILLV